jgi:predicted Rossmann-fold nucleotide-binding protein
MDQQARDLVSRFPDGPRVVVIGSTDFWHPESERCCTQAGQLLAEIPGLTLITGGVEGVGEATGRSFFRARREAEQEPRIYHVLPEGESSWDYGETLFAGANMAERREILARLARLYLAVEGGPGTKHEAEVASAQGAIVIPVGRSGGFSAALYSRSKRPPGIPEGFWAVLDDEAATPEEAASAAVSIVRLGLMAVD